MNRDELLSELTGDILTYVMDGRVSDGLLASGIKPEGLDERYEDYRLLVDLHFILRDDVVEFVRNLPEHLRQLETSTLNRTRTTRGSVQGRINWTETARRRSTESPGDRSLFVCDTRTENYDTDENLVLKRLLSVVYDTVGRTERFLKRDYTWVNRSWAGEENLIDELRRVFERNVHVRRIRDPEQYEPTERMVTAASASRQAVYREAARLIGDHRAVHRGDEEAIRDLLERTAITPDDDETLFELFVLFRFISTIEEMRDGAFELQTIESGRQEVARFDGEKRIVLYHDNAAGDRNLSFRSVPKERDDDELSRTEMVQREAHRVARRYFDEPFENQTGRPDVIVLEVVDEAAGVYEYLITEVKNSTDTDTIRTGIKETLEYLAFFRQDGEFVHDGADSFFGDGSNGLLVVQDLERETQPLEEQEGIRILQASELDGQLSRVLDGIV